MAQFQLFDIPKNQTEFSTKEVMAITGFTKEASDCRQKLFQTRNSSLEQLFIYFVSNF